MNLNCGPVAKVVELATVRTFSFSERWLNGLRVPVYLAFHSIDVLHVSSDFNNVNIDLGCSSTMDCECQQTRQLCEAVPLRAEQGKH
jgi:hypothetical protein